MTTLITFGQNESNIVSIIDTPVNPAGVIDELELPPPSTIGNHYLFDNWNQGSFTINGSKKIDGVELKYDLKHDALEVMYKGEIKVCPITLLKSFQWQNSASTSSFFLKIESEYQTKFNIHGVWEVLYKGERLNLYSYPFLELKESTYVPTVDVGRRDNKLIKKESYFLEGSNMFYRLSPSIKKNRQVFGDSYPEVEKFVKENKLKSKKRLDLVKIVEYYDSLLDD